MSKANQETPSKSKRRSAQLDFSNLGPLKTTGTVGFTAFRDSEGDGTRRRKARKKSNGNVGTTMQDDSDDDDDDDDEDILGKMQDVDDKDTTQLAPDDSKFSGELAEGVDRMKVSSNPDTHAWPRISTDSGPSTAQAGSLCRPRHPIRRGYLERQASRRSRPVPPGQGRQRQGRAVRLRLPGCRRQQGGGHVDPRESHEAAQA